MNYIDEQQALAFTFNHITHDAMLALYDRERAELMKLSKEELVEKLIGKREEVGMPFV